MDVTITENQKPEIEDYGNNLAHQEKEINACSSYDPDDNSTFSGLNYEWHFVNEMNPLVGDAALSLKRAEPN